MDWSAVAKNITEEYPFVEFILEDGKIRKVIIDKYLYIMTIGYSVSRLCVMIGSVTCNFELEKNLHTESASNLIIQTLLAVPAFHIYLTIYETKKLIQPLEAQIKEIYTMLSYAPGGPGYEEAKDNFKKLI
nr:hypothetical protein K-LCC10_0200 [Kaumoebavirus]